jgi:hypothetical protein
MTTPIPITTMPDDVVGQMMTNLDCLSIVRASRVCKRFSMIVLDVPAVLEHYGQLHSTMRRRLEWGWGAAGRDISRFSGRAIRTPREVGGLEPHSQERDFAAGWRSGTFEALVSQMEKGRWLAVRFAIPTLPKNRHNWADHIFAALNLRASEQLVRAMVSQYQPEQRAVLDGKYAAAIIQTGDINFMEYCHRVLSCETARFGIRQVADAIKRHLESTKSKAESP